MGIGNMLMFMPLLRALRRRHPGARIVAVGMAPNGSECVLRAEPGLVDEMVLLNPDKAPRWKLLWRAWRLGRQGWDTVILRYHGIFGEVVLATAAARTRNRVGHVSSSGWRNRWDSIINVSVPMIPGSHEVARYMELGGPFGIDTSKVEFSYPTTLEDNRLAEKILDDHGLSEKEFICLQPGSSQGQKWKRWPEERWQEFVQLATGRGLKVVCLGSDGEGALCARICGANQNAVSLAGKSTLGATARILKRALLLVGGDSNLVHFAAAVGTPVLGLWAAGDECKGKPLVRHRLIRASICKGPCHTLERNYIFPANCDPARCMRSIAAPEVLAAVFEMVAENEVAIAAVGAKHK